MNAELEGIRRKDLLVIVKISWVVLLLFSLSSKGNDYFSYIQFIGLLIFCFFAFHEKDDSQRLFFWLFSAVLINPFFQVPLEVEFWTFIKVIWIAYTIFSMIPSREKSFVLTPNPTPIPIIEKETIAKEKDLKEKFEKFNSTVKQLFCPEVNEDLLWSVYHKLYHKTPNEFVEHYNDEIDEGLSGKGFQIYKLLAFHSLFHHHFQRSPLRTSSFDVLAVRGKIYLTPRGFEYVNSDLVKVIRMKSFFEKAEKELKTQKVLQDVFEEIKTEEKNKFSKTYQTENQKRAEEYKFLNKRYNYFKSLDETERKQLRVSVRKWVYELFEQHRDVYGYFKNSENIVHRLDSEIVKAVESEIYEKAYELFIWREKLKSEFKIKLR